MGIDFNKLNPEEAQKIINALKDGRINDNEAKDLKLTKAEQEALNKAFSGEGSEVQIGDFVLVNKGKSKDGKMQYSETRKMEPNEEPSFWEKAANKLKKDAAGYVKNFRDAWNNSSGAIDTAKSLAGATAKNIKDFVGDAADNIEKGVTDITGSETAGKWVRGMSSPGLADAILDATQGDYDGIKNVGSSIGKTLAAPFAVFSSCTEEPMLPKIEINDNTQVNIGLKIEKTDISPLLEAFNKGFADLKKEMEEARKQNAEYNENNVAYQNAVLELILTNNEYLKNMATQLEQTGKTTEEILKEVSNTNATVKNIERLLNSINDNITINGESLKQQLNEILEAIKSGNADIDLQIGNLNDLLSNIIMYQKDQIKLQEGSNIKLDEILDKLNDSDINTSDKLAMIVDLLKNIESIGVDINNKLDEIKNTVTEINNKVENDPDVKAALDKLLELVSKNNDKADITNQLLEKLISMYENSNISKDDIAAIINAINKNGEKIDATNQLLAKMQDQDEKFQAQVLKLLGNVGADYTDVLNKILDAVNNGNAKLDDVTKLLAKMQNQDLEFQENVLNAINDLGTNITGVLNNILTNIGNDSAKLDQITQLLAKIDSNIQKYGEDGKTLGNNILNAIKKLGSDVSNISTKLTQILNVVNADKDTGKNIEALLNKVLANMDSNTAKIIDAIANIKIEGGGSSGNVDLTSIEAMLKELVELTKDNNNTLTDINGKLDVIKVTQQAILDKINVEANKNDERYVKVDAFMKEVLEKLSSSAANGYDDSKLMEVLSKLSNMIDTRLEEILNAIKDHDVNVTVDVTGKVTCECNCGKPHEGILGDLEDALG